MNGRVVGKPVDLPKTEFRLTGIDLYGTIIEPKDLVHLEGTFLYQELYLPGSQLESRAGQQAGRQRGAEVSGRVDQPRETALQYPLPDEC
jgi:hypothetical protein